MNDVDKIRLKESMKKLFIQYAGSKSIAEKDELYNLWCEDLAESKIDEVEIAIDLYRKNPDNKFFPKPYVIIGLIKKNKPKVDGSDYSTYNMLKYLIEREPCNSAWANNDMPCTYCYKTKRPANITDCMYEHLKWSRGYTEDISFQQLHRINAERQHAKMFPVFKLVWVASDHKYIMIQNEQQYINQINENKKWIEENNYYNVLAKQSDKVMNDLQTKMFDF